MKKLCVYLAAAFLCLLTLAGCQNAQEPSPAPSATSSPEPTGQDAPACVQIIREIMTFDTSMSVSAYNEAITALCEDAGTSIFAVISDAYDYFAVYENGAFVATQFESQEMERFVDTTLEHSSQELFGEPVHMGSATYLTTDELTAQQMQDQKDSLTSEEWYHFFDSQIGNMTNYTTFFYTIDTQTPDAANLTIEQRDAKIAAIRDGIQSYLCGLNIATVRGEGLADLLQAELDRLAQQHSDDAYLMQCEAQSLEHSPGE